MFFVRVTGPTQLHSNYNIAAWIQIEYSSGPLDQMF